MIEKLDMAMIEPKKKKKFESEKANFAVDHRGDSEKVSSRDFIIKSECMEVISLVIS